MADMPQASAEMVSKFGKSHAKLTLETIRFRGLGLLFAAFFGARAIIEPRFHQCLLPLWQNQQS